jgi:DNA-binding GntR family transcriptional regulator
MVTRWGEDGLSQGGGSVQPIAPAETSLRATAYYILMDMDVEVDPARQILKEGPPPWASPAWAEDRRRVGATVRDRVARELRSQILLGELAPGDRIDLDALASELGTSRTPIREACLELAHDNLVRMAPRSGVTVIGISATDLQDNFALMASLSGMAAAWAATRATTEDLDEIVAQRDAVAEAVRSGRDPSVENYEFHRQINRASHSPRLAVLIAQTARLFPDNFFQSVPEQIPCSLAEHDGIVAALQRHDAVEARTLTESHFQHAAGLLAAMSSQERPSTES